MKRVAIIGRPGSGKSTFARALREATGLPVYYLDQIYWHPDKTHITNEELAAEHANLIMGDEWIIDGTYAHLLPARLARCDTAFWMDYPLEVCLRGIEERRGKPREDLPWVENEPDEDFIAYARSFDMAFRFAIEDALSDAKHLEIHHFRGRQQAARFLAGLNA